jgi:hypothetical protein
MKVTIYEQSAQLPALPEGSFFHSRELMELCERTPRHKPYMAVVTDNDGAVVANLLAIARVQRSWLPPLLNAHVRIYGENNCPANQFGLVLNALTERLQNRTLYIEVSNLTQKMYGYRELRSAGFFPVRWMTIHNSLHSRTPEERIRPRQLKRIVNAQHRGAKTKIVETTSEFQAFSKLLHHHNHFKLQRYIPDDSFFRQMIEEGHCQVFITTYRRKVIGCAVCVYSGGDAYLWHTAARRKSYAPLHPNAVTLWAAIQNAHSIGMQHIRFLDVGLPFRRNLWRDFILRFGGKEVSGYRWFRISIRWVNSLASWLWRE